MKLRVGPPGRDSALGRRRSAQGAPTARRPSPHAHMRADSTEPLLGADMQWSSRIPIASAGQDEQAPAVPPRSSQRPPPRGRAPGTASRRGSSGASSTSSTSSSSAGMGSTEESESLALTVVSCDVLAQSLPGAVEFDDSLDQRYRTRYSLLPFELPSARPLDMAQLQRQAPAGLRAWHGGTPDIPPRRASKQQQQQQRHRHKTASIAQRLEQPGVRQRLHWDQPSFAASRGPRPRPASLTSMPRSLSSHTPSIQSAASVATPRSGASLYPGIAGDDPGDDDASTSPLDPHYRIPSRPDTATLHMNVTHAEALLLLEARKARLAKSRPKVFSFESCSTLQEDWEEATAQCGLDPALPTGASLSRWSATNSVMSQEPRQGQSPPPPPKSPCSEKAALEEIWGDRYEGGDVV